MTTEQAIRILKAEMYGNPDMTTILTMAMNMAILALEKQAENEEGEQND